MVDALPASRRTLAATLRSLTGWRALAAALLAGAVATLAMPPLDITPALLVSLPVLFWLTDAAPRPRAAFFVGVSFGVGHFSTGLYWIVFAYLVPPAQYAALGVPSVIGLALLLALFVGGAGATYTWTATRLGRRLASDWRRILLYSVCFVVFEWLRGHVLSGFPWNQIAHTWSFSDTMSQGAAVFGAYGLSLLTMIALTLPAAGWRAAAAGGAMLLAMAGGGAWRLGGDDGAVQPGINLRVVQPNVAQADKWRQGLMVAHIRNLLKLSTMPGTPAPNVLIWPETATTVALDGNPGLLQAIGEVVPPGGYVLTGAPRFDTDAEGRREVFNSLEAIDDNGRIVARYDKFHLVPFGEYIPLHHWLPLEQTIGRGSFESGPGPQTISLPGLPPVSPLICYEVIFPGAVVDESHRPSWIVNITNDAWFGVSSGPYQHLASARLRAIEEGLPLVRSANTGISAVIDAYGHIVARLGLEKTGVIDQPLPAALPPTPYSRFGDLMLIVLIVPIAVLTFRAIPRNESS